MARVGAVVAVVAFLAGCGGGGGKEAGPPSNPDPKRGRAILIQSGCTSCHSIPSAGINRRHAGPDLDLVAARYDAAFIRHSIEKPGDYLERGSEGKIGGTDRYAWSMPAYGPRELPPQQLTEQQLADLIAFIESTARP